jgi:hypothetical protein
MVRCSDEKTILLCMLCVPLVGLVKQTNLIEMDRVSNFRILYSCMFPPSTYEGESTIIRNAVAFVFPLAALSLSRALLGIVSFLSLMRRFEVSRSVPLSQL